MNWRLVLILLKLIDRFGFPYFLVLVSFWFAKAVEQELQRRVTSPSLSSRWPALSAKHRHKNNQRPSAMKKIMKFSPGKVLSIGLTILAALAVATPQAQGSSCTSPPAGLVSWWAGERNANDIVGGNNGSPVGNLGYTNGVAGQAFVFDGSTSYSPLSASPSLNIGATGSGITIECWIKPVAGVNAPVIEWDSATSSGVQLWVANGNTLLFANIEDTSGNPRVISFPYIFDTNNFQHVAVTYDKDSGLAVLYLNGTNVASANFGSITPQTTYPVNIGRRTGQPVGNGDTFGGLIDELSLYNRALSQAEIQAIYNAGSAGKCAPVTMACTPPPAGIVGWWKADGSTVDGVGGNNGVNQNISYTNGVVGQAFACDPDTFPWGTYTGIQVADRPAYALTNALTIETWLRPRGNGYVIFFRGDHRPGMDPYYLSMQANNTLRFGVCDAAGNSAFVETTVNYFAWTHVAATLNGAAGTLSLYTNGVLAAQTVTTVRPFADLLPDQSPGIGIGNVNDGGNNFPFIGDIDEIALYNRALSQAEIQSIANAGGAGKCVPLATTCVTPPSGIVAWWPAEGNANDIVGTNNGILQAGASYAVGKVGRAFFLNNANAYVRVPASASLKNIATANGLTIEGWIDVTNVAGLHPIAEFSDGVGNYGVQLWVGSNPSDNGLLYAALVDTNGNYHQLYSPQYTIITNTFQHIALTCDKASGAGTLYVNGVIVAQSTWASFSPQTDYDLWLGHRSQSCGGGCWTYGTYLGGLLDELSLYNRALSQTEIQSIYNAGGAGKCAPQTGMLSQQLINIDFGAGGGRGYSLKTGFAAIGQATNDFWNFYDRDVYPSPYDWRTSGALVNLQLANGTLRSVGVSVSDASGAWNDESSDSMYKTYDYPLDGGNNVVAITNLAAGQNNVLAYSPDGNFEVTVGGISYGVKTTYDSPASSVPVWTEGVQYACFRNVTVAAGQPLGLTVRNGVSNPALLSGMQIVSSGIMSNLPPTILSQTPSQVVLLGNTATFSVTASGSHPLSYFWKRNGAIISGATNFSYTLNNAQLSDSGSKFSCLVTNAYGLAASTNATLKVIDTIANDLCSGAIIITNASYTNVQSTVRASSFGDPVPDCVTGFGNGVWYQFTAPVNGLLIVDTFGSDFDTGLAIYTGSCDALTEAACNDDTTGVNSQVTMPATGGTTYSILVGGYSAHAANLVLHLIPL